MNLNKIHILKETKKPKGDLEASLTVSSLSFLICDMKFRSEDPVAPLSSPCFRDSRWNCVQGVCGR